MIRIGSKYPDPSVQNASLKVVIFGAGIAGKSAYEMAKKIGATPILIEKNSALLPRLREQGYHVISMEENLVPTLQSSDILIGCAHSMGKRAEYVIHFEQLAFISKEKKKLMMDISIDQGGNFPESHSTSYAHPIYSDSFGNIRFGVPNIPSLAGRYASEKLTEASIQYTELIAMDGLDAINRNQSLKNAINIQKGKILIEAIKLAHQTKLSSD